MTLAATGVGRNSYKFVIVCKTYRNDLESFRRLLKSYKKYNADKIELIVSVPELDYAIFSECVGEDALVITDESYAAGYFTNEQYWGLSSGYINQEICKLSFWETGIAENYLCVDSDAYFIRDFNVSDFMADAITPYSVLVMDKDLNTETFYKEFSESRSDLIKKIFNAVDYPDRRYRTCHGMTVLNAKVLADFKQNYLRKNKLTYSKLIEISPYEYSWYNSWLQKSKIVEVVAVEPFFKTYHMRIEYVMSRFKMISEKDLAKQYVGIILNSNWKSKKVPKYYQSPNFLHRTAYKILERI